MDPNVRMINTYESQYNFNQLFNKDNNTNNNNPFQNAGFLKGSNDQNMHSYNFNNNINANNFNNNINNNNFNNNINANNFNNNINRINNINNINKPQHIINPFLVHNQNNQNSINNINNQNIPNFNYINNDNSLNKINYRLIRCGKKFNNNDVNIIINSSNEELKTGSDPLSKCIIQRIKNLLGGNWVVFVCVNGLKGYDLSVSVEDENRLISFIIDNFKFQIIKIGD